MTKVDDVAAVLLQRLGPMSTIKFEALVYYAQAWNAALGETPLFPDPIEAGPNGPRVRHLYDQHRRRHIISEWPAGNPEAVGEVGRELIRTVADRYGQFSDEDISRMVAIEEPWRAARRGLSPKANSRRVIPLEIMKEFYRRLVSGRELAVTHAVANAALEGLQIPEEDIPILEDVATGSDPDEAAYDLTRKHHQVQ